MELILPEEAKLIAGEILEVTFAFSFNIRDLNNSKNIKDAKLSFGI